MKKIIFLSIFIFLFSNISLGLEIIQIDQTKIRVSISPEEVKTGVINITNPTSEKKDIRVYLEDWCYIPPYDGSKEFKPASTLENSCSSWIVFSPAEFSLPAFGRKIINYTIRIPKDAVGSHHSVMFFEEMLGDPPKIEEGVGVGVAVRIGVLFYVEPKGTILRDVRIENLSAEKKDDFLEIKGELLNTGNADITIKGDFHIIDKKGIVYARGKFNDIYTFPGDKAKLSSKVIAKLKEGIYDLVITLQFEEGGLKVLEAEIYIDSKGRITKILTKP